MVVLMNWKQFTFLQTFEKGQIRSISDHNQILPLYDYGIGTYDFDMKKVKPMVKLAQAKAEEDTLEFFNTP